MANVDKKTWKKGCLFGCLPLVLIVIICAIFSTKEESTPKIGADVPQTSRKQQSPIIHGINLETYLPTARAFWREINKDEGKIIVKDMEPVEKGRWKVVWEVGSGWYNLTYDDRESFIRIEYIGLLKHTTGATENQKPELIYVDKNRKRVAYVCGYTAEVY